MHEVQRSAVQPGHDERVVVDLVPREAVDPGAQGEPHGARILRLDGEQVAHELGGREPLGPVQQLGRGPRAGQLPLNHGGERKRSTAFRLLDPHIA